MKKRVIRILAGGIVLFIAILLNTSNHWLNLGLFLISFLIVGGDVVLDAVKNIIKGQIFDENFLMSIATIGAFLIGEYPEGVAVMLFYQVGELFQSYAVRKSRKSIANLMDIRPDYANVKRNDEIFQVDPQEVQIGEVIIIKPGEKVPLDGVVIEGSTMLDTSALTGESVPREVFCKDEILSGCINLNKLILVKVTKEYGESTVSKILDLVENATSKKSKSEQFITKFARYYTPIVVVIAIALAIIPPLVISGETYKDWIYRALSFLVVSCPCALVISIPLSFFGGIGGASRSGILVKGSNYLEALAKVELVVFDKTGTLTKGVFNVQEMNPVEMSEQQLLEIAAHAQNYSNHPISTSIKRAYRKEIDNSRISDFEEFAGYGVAANVDNRKVLVGNAKLMDQYGISFEQGVSIGTTVHVAIENRYAGRIVISDEMKSDARQAISQLKKSGIERVVMLTGDTKEVAIRVASDLSIDEVYYELLPGNKVDKVDELLSQMSKSSNVGKLAFVGDGINDAPVLARADIGIAMGGLGSDAAIEAADIVIMTDEPSKIHAAIKIAKRTLVIAQQNIVFSIGIKVVVLILSALGLATMWAAVFADVGVTVIAILNSFRALKVDKN